MRSRGGSHERRVPLRLRRCCRGCCRAAGARRQRAAGVRLAERFAAEPVDVGTALDALKNRLAAANTKGLSGRPERSRGLRVVRTDHSATTKHYTASMAKAIVGGLSIAVALTDRRLALDDNVSKYVPQWKSDPRKSRITIRQLGSHTSGLEDAEADKLPHDKLTGWKGDFWKRLEPPNDPFTIARDRTPALFESGREVSVQQSRNRDADLCAHVRASRCGIERDVRTLLRDRVMRPIGVPDDDWSVGYGATYTVEACRSWRRGAEAVTPRGRRARRAVDAPRGRVGRARRF